jgi:hypothetical protein
MTLNDISAIAQAVSAVAILISLLAVYGQVRQTNKIARAELTHSVWLGAGQMQPSFYDTAEKAELMHRALYGAGPLSAPERLRVDTVLATIMGLHEAAFTLRKRGLIEPDIYNTFEATTRLYTRSLIMQEWWARFRTSGKDAGYVALVDAMIAQHQSQAAQT